MTGVVRSGGRNGGARGKPGSSPNVWQELRRLVVVMLGLLAAVGALGLALARQMPALPPQDFAVLRAFPPRSLSALVEQRDLLLSYSAKHPLLTGAGLSIFYVTQQAFAIPGTVGLSVLAGALYGVWRGWILVAVVSTLGSCASYCLSWLLGRQLAHAIWPERLAAFGGEVRRHRRALLGYVLFLRVTPLLPNTFINVASPIVGVPLLPFAVGTLLGTAPQNFVAVTAGSRLGELTSLADLYDPRVILLGLAAGALALVSVYLKRRAAGPSALLSAKKAQ